MVAGRSSAVFRCLRLRERNRRIWCVSRASGPPIHRMGSSAGNGATSGAPAALGNRSRRGDNPLYWRLKPAARKLSGPRPKGLKYPIRGNLLTKN